MAKYVSKIIVILLVSSNLCLGQKASEVVIDSNTVWRLSLTEFIQRSEGKHADILGGCVSITEGAMATSVIMMALEVTTSRDTNMPSLKNELINRMIDSLKSMQDSLTLMADRDRSMFKVYLKVYHLNSKTAAEKRIRDSAIGAANLEATIPPIQSAGIMIGILQILERSIPLCSKATISDAFASAHLLKGALDATLAIANDDIRQLKMKDKVTFEKISKRYADQSSLLIKQITFLQNRLKKY